jgi:hypothetical protein
MELAAQRQSSSRDSVPSRTPVAFEQAEIRIRSDFSPIISTRPAMMLLDELVRIPFVDAVHYNF